MATASLWDLVSAWMHTERRPQDFVWALEVPPDVIERIEARAAKSAELVPRVQARLQGEAWVEGSPPPVIRREAPVEDVVAEALAGSVHPACGPPLRLFAVAPETLVVHTHHALCDLAGFLVWLDALLEHTAPTGDLRLKPHPSARRKSRFAPAGRSRRLATRATGAPRIRAALDLELDSAPLAEAARGQGASYNDRLALAFLDALADHQRAFDARTDRLALWLPINVRESPFEGFGNGTSRLRIYRDALEGDDPAARRASFAAQREAAKADGEWHVPSARPAPGLPLGLVKAPLLAYLNRPWVDMGSAPFSHASRLGPEGRFIGVTPRTLIMNLHPWHPVGLSGATHAGRTHLTFTYDPSELSPEDVAALKDSFLDHLGAR